MMQLIGFLLPIAALYGYYTGHMTLFYWTGSIVAVLDIIAVLNGSLRCWGSLLTIACWRIACSQTDGTWEGIILGSCYAFIVLMGMMSIVFIPMILAGIAGILLYPFIWIRDRLNRE